LADFEEKESKKLDEFLLDENHELEKQIKKMENEINIKTSEWNT
jgi:cell division septum initiation protein DivIVA